MILPLPRMLPLLASVLVLAGVPLSARADRFDVLGAQQVTPGSVSVTVALDGRGRPRPGDLALEIDGAKPVAASEIASARRTGGASDSLVFCVDRSGSIGPAALGELKSAFGEVLKAQGSPELGFKVSVIGFGTRIQIGDFSDRTDEVVSAIEQIEIEPRGRTRLYDAIASALARLRAEGEGGRRLIVASDGKDAGSTLSARRLAELAQQSPVIPIDAMSFGALAAGESGSLALIAGATGGRFIQVGDPGQLGRAIRTLLSDAVPAPTFKATFSYPPSTDNRPAGLATLVYKPDGGVAVRRPLGIAVAAQAQELVNAPPAGNGASGDGGRWTFRVVFAWVRALPAVYAWMAAVVVALLLLLLVFMLRAQKKEKSDPEPAGGNVEISVLEVTTSSSPAPPPKPASRRHTFVGHAWPAPRPGYPAAILRGVSGASRGQQFAIDKAVYRIGCTPDNDMVLVGDNFASGHHALVRFENDSLYVEDLGATNGTLLNGSLFKSATRSLSPGDELRFGRTTLMLQTAGDGRAPPTGPGRSGIEQSLA